MNEFCKSALEDIMVLDLSRVLSGPFASMWLGDLGADVIKIEIPEEGDEARLNPIFINGFSSFFATVNRNKKSITLNLKSTEGKNMFLELVKQADVVLQNFRPGVMKRLGLEYEVLCKVNPQIIFATVSGFGEGGSYSQRPAYDLIAQAMGGIMALTGLEGGEPTRVGVSIADITAGMNIVIGILAALHARTHTGMGQKIEVAMVDSIIALAQAENNRYFISGGQPVQRTGNRYPNNCPFGTYKARDGVYMIACGKDKQFQELCKIVLGRPEIANDPRYNNIEARVAHHEEVRLFLEAWSEELTVDEVVNRLLDANIPASPIYSMNEISKDPYIVENRKMFIKMNQPVIGEMTVTAMPIKFSDTKPTIRMPAPLLGQHNEEVFKEMLGIDSAQIGNLKKKGII